MYNNNKYNFYPHVYFYAIYEKILLYILRLYEYTILQNEQIVLKFASVRRLK